MNSTRQMVWLTRSMFSSFNRAKTAIAHHRESNFHQLGVDIHGAATGLFVEIAQRVGEGVLHDGRQRIELRAIEAFLNQSPLRAPGVSMGGEQALPQKVAHALYLNFGFLVVLRIGL